MTTAATKVLNTAELLEQIILELPTRQIFVIQRINTTFLNVIKRSIWLQKALYLRPTTDHILKLFNTKLDARNCSSSKDCDVPYVESWDDAWERMRGTARWALDSSDRKHHIVTLNPAIASYSGTFQRFAEEKKLFRSATRARMLLTQPPVNALIVETNSRYGHYHFLRASDPWRGVTFGDLEACLNAFAGRLTVAEVRTWEELPEGSTAVEVLVQLQNAAAS